MTTRAASAANIAWWVLIAIGLGAIGWAAVGPRSLASRLNARASTILTVDDAPILGAKTAPVIMTIFSDFGCKYCAIFSKDVLPELESRYVLPKQLLVAFRHFPLATTRDASTSSAIAAECAHRQGKFWEMSRLLYEPASRTHREALERELPRKLELKISTYAECFRSDGLHRIDGDVALGEELQITGTPSFVFGIRTGDGRFAVADRLQGAQRLDAFSAIIDNLLELAATTK